MQQGERNTAIDLQVIQKNHDLYLKQHYVVFLPGNINGWFSIRLFNFGCLPGSLSQEHDCQVHCSATLSSPPPPLHLLECEVLP